MPDDGLEYIHRLIVIDNIDKLQCSDPSTAIWLKLDEPFRREPDQRFTHRGSGDLVLTAQSLLLQWGSRLNFKRDDGVAQRCVDPLRAGGWLCFSRGRLPSFRSDER